MPRARTTVHAPQPGTPLIPLPIAAPGSLGLNLQESQKVLPGEWCIEAQNAVIDVGGRIAARLGFSSAGAAAGSQIRTIHEYKVSAGTVLPVVAYDGGISSSLSAPSGSSLVGTITSVASGRWYFQNFNGKCIGFQAGQKPIVMQNQAGTFSNISESAGTAPTGGVGCAAFGRVWGMAADGQTLQWCALLDETNWGTGDSGSVILTKVWTQGVDTVQAIAAWNQCLVVFGLRQILIFGSTTVSAIGLDVTNMQLMDVIEGTGCISQWTLAPIGRTDLLFCSPIGIQSMGRLEIQKSRPTDTLSKYCRDSIINMLKVESNLNNVGAFYSPTNGFYALYLPVSGYVWIADMRHIHADSADGSGDLVAPMTRWNIILHTGIEFTNRNLYADSNFATSNNSQVAIYNGSNGDNGTAFTFVVQTPFVDFGQDIGQRLKALKRVGSLIYARANTNVTYTWYIDFGVSGFSETRTVNGSTGSEWGTAQWAIDQWGSGVLTAAINTPASGSGRYFSLGISAAVATSFAVQQVNMLCKVLRIA